MQDDKSETGPTRFARWKILLLAAMFIAPVVIAYTLYLSGWRSERTVNHGQLIVPPKPLADEALATMEGQKTSLAALKQKWTLLYLGPTECLKPCTENLYKMQQVVLALGKDRIRLNRVYLVTDRISLETLRPLVAQYPDTLVLHGEPESVGRLVRQFGVNGRAFDPTQHRVYIVDPLGNLMMTYRADADPSGMRKDLLRLLKVSRVG